VLRLICAAMTLATSVVWSTRIAEGEQSVPASITGIVWASAAGTPLVDALVEVVEGEAVARTDPNGRFRLAGLAAGTIVLAVHRLGYRRLEIEIDLYAGEEFVIPPGTIVLEAVPVQLPEVSVEAPSGMVSHLAKTGFYERRDEGFGVFVERDDIEAWNPKETTDILSRLQGVRVRPNPLWGKRPSRLEPPDMRRVIIEMSRAPVQDCDPIVFLDGMFMGSTATFELNRTVAYTEVEAVEVYRGPAEVPPRFNYRGASCGVIAFWSR
jgi:hypothetical protein